MKANYKLAEYGKRELGSSQDAEFNNLNKKSFYFGLLLGFGGGISGWNLGKGIDMLNDSNYNPYTFDTTLYFGKYTLLCGFAGFATGATVGSALGMGINLQQGKSGGTR